MRCFRRSLIARSLCLLALLALLVLLALLALLALLPLLSIAVPGDLSVSGWLLLIATSTGSASLDNLSLVLGAARSCCA